LSLISHCELRSIVYEKNFQLGEDKLCPDDTAARVLSMGAVGKSLSVLKDLTIRAD